MRGFKAAEREDYSFVEVVGFELLETAANRDEVGLSTFVDRCDLKQVKLISIDFGLPSLK